MDVCVIFTPFNFRLICYVVIGLSTAKLAFCFSPLATEGTMICHLYMNVRWCDCGLLRSMTCSWWKNIGFSSIQRKFCAYYFLESELLFVAFSTWQVSKCMSLLCHMGVPSYFAMAGRREIQLYIP